MKYSGKAGFKSESVETRPGTYQNQSIERRIKGDVLSYGTRYNTQQNSTIDNVRITNRLSIVMDPFLRTHIGEMLWVSFSGSKWKVDSFTVQSPRIIIDLGGLYNE